MPTGNPFTSGMAAQSMLPTDYSMENSQLMRRQQMADILRKQALEQDSGNQMSGGWVVRKSPFEGMTKLAQALASNKIQQGVDDRQMALARQLREQGTADMGKVMEALRGSPEKAEPFQADNPFGEDLPEGMQTVTPAVAPDRKQAMALALQSQNPTVQGVGAKLMENEMKTPKGININGQMVNENTGEAMGTRISKEPEAFSLSPGQTRYGPDGKPLAVSTNPNQAFNPDGTPNKAYMDYELLLRAKGAPNVSVKNEVNTGKSLSSEIGPMMKDSTAIAEGAVKQANSANNLLKAIDSGKIISGTGANLRLKGAQISQMLGIGGKDEAEQIENTRAAIRELAQATLYGRQQMKGQGAITEGEAKVAQKANSGEIDDLTIPEMRQLAMAANRAARFNYAEHMRKMKVIESDKELRMLAPFYQGPAMPGEYSQAKPAGNAKFLGFE